MEPMTDVVHGSGTHPSSTGDADADMRPLVIGTRGSILALVQTEDVQKALQKVFPKQLFNVETVKTLGDRDKITSLPEFNAKSLWVHDLEVPLLSGRLDMIAHSLKDVPTQLPVKCMLGAVLKRENPHDALIISPRLIDQYQTLASLPEGSVVGTSSLRRKAQILRLYPHLVVKDCRGNVDTRLKKLDAEDSEFAAIVIAAAGLNRMNLSHRITRILRRGKNPTQEDLKEHAGMLYAVGQGAIGVESRVDDDRINKMLDLANCERTMLACLAERSLLRTLEGGCSVPIGVETEWVTNPSTTPSPAVSKSAFAPGAGVGAKPALEYDKLTGSAVHHAHDKQEEETDELTMRAIVLSVDGREAVETEVTKLVTSRAGAEQFGFEVAGLLVQKGADKILDKIRLNRPIIEEQGNA